MDLHDIRPYVDDRPDDGVFRVHSSVYADPALFELEQRHIFERTWNFIAHESQVPRAHDFVTTTIGRVPVLVTRDAGGAIRAFVNACRHKGAVVTRMAAGNRKYHTCAYHGWSYGSDGRSAGIKDHAAGGYTQAFDAEDHGLVPLASLATYRGFVFGALATDLPPIETFLDGMKFFIDLAVDQGAEGMEFVPGRIAFTYEGNWKLQMENGIDAYHLTSTHAGFMDVMARRSAGIGNLEAKQFDWQKRFSQAAGSYQFANGHAAIWIDQPEVRKRPIWPRIDEIRARVGETRAEWMLRGRNVTVFPNMQLADATNLLVRVARPLSVDRTEVQYWCFAPCGETREQRSWRLRQFEDFFNVSGLATPDDTVLYEDCQRGLGGTPPGWLQGHARGMTLEHPGPNDLARRAGLAPLSSAQGMFDASVEVCFHPFYREWARLMHAGMTGAKPW